MTIKQLKYELRLNDFRGDSWGTTMQAFFTLADVMYYKFGYCPTEWGYRPGAFGPHIDNEDYFAPMFKRLGEKKLSNLGQYLHRVSRLLQHLGKDY